MLAMDYEPSMNFKDLWPSMWCEWASIGISEALRVRGQGEWTFVQHGRPDDLGGHAWLELRADSGSLQYTIDATLHQFGRYGSQAFFGDASTPAAAEFTEVNYEGPWRGWKVLSYKPQYITFAEATLRQMGH